MVFQKRCTAKPQAAHTSRKKHGRLCTHQQQQLHAQAHCKKCCSIGSRGDSFDRKMEDLSPPLEGASTTSNVIIRSSAMSPDAAAAARSFHPVASSSAEPHPPRDRSRPLISLPIASTHRIKARICKLDYHSLASKQPQSATVLKPWRKTVHGTHIYLYKPDGARHNTVG